MNPLFRQFSNFVHDEARREFMASTTGQLVREIERLGRSRSGNSTRITRLTRDLLNAARAGGLSHQLKQTAPGQFFAEVERYAAGGAKRALLDSLFGALGPLGDLFKSLLRPSRTSRSPIERDIDAARNLLRVFRPDLLRETQRSPVPSSRRIGLPDDVNEARKLLESMGFTITPPKPQFPYLDQPELPPRRVTSQTTEYAPDDPILTGEMIKVDSSNVHSIGFVYEQANPKQSTLKVRFWQRSVHGGIGKVAGPLYFYYRVPPEVFERFRAVSSKGKFVWDELRVRGTVSGHQYQYELKGVAQGYVPRKATRYGPNEYFIRRRIRGVHQKTGRVQYIESQLPDVRARSGRMQPKTGTRIGSR